MLSGFHVTVVPGAVLLIRSQYVCMDEIHAEILEALVSVLLSWSSCCSCVVWRLDQGGGSRFSTGVCFSFLGITHTARHPLRTGNENTNDP